MNNLVYRINDDPLFSRSIFNTPSKHTYKYKYHFEQTDEMLTDTTRLLWEVVTKPPKIHPNTYPQAQQNLIPTNFITSFENLQLFI